ncbi:hypothetical protein Godav_013427 [Gossypium davidsonii]|uniref:Uncharacterized protein n=2 Tax=Gossypium TaxID=3633 RepID=A0A7J8RGB1_GOSDV|nr:hypothetical protein [Gossypium davidsonii]MBA0648079.1 hypothetical protein [Gossypium klotzschianum]
MQTTCTRTERSYEASLFPRIGFGLFLRNLGGRQRRPPSKGARAMKRPDEASLFPRIGFGLFLRSLCGRRRGPPSVGARAMNEIPLWKS